MVKPFAAAVLAAVLLCGPASAARTAGDPAARAAPPPHSFACAAPPAAAVAVIAGQGFAPIGGRQDGEGRVWTIWLDVAGALLVTVLRREGLCIIEPAAGQEAGR